MIGGNVNIILIVTSLIKIFVVSIYDGPSDWCIIHTL